MKRLSILMDDIAVIRSNTKKDLYDPVKYGILCEHFGANGLVRTCIDKKKGFNENDLRYFKELHNTFLNLRIPIQDEAIRLALSIVPDMVTFIELESENSSKAAPVNPGERQSEFEKMLSDFQANNISVSILIKPELNILKGMSKLAMDYIEIDASDYTEAIDINEEIVALDKIKSAALAVSKWGMGINCSGNISYNDITALAQIPNIEDITLDSHFIHRSMLVGIEKAVQEALQLIRYKEID